MSGPMILSASSHIRDIQPDRYVAEIDLKPALDFEHLDRRIQNDFKENSNRDVSNAFSKLLPRKIIVPVLKRWGVPFDKSVIQLQKRSDMLFVKFSNALRLKSAVSDRLRRQS